VPTLTCGLVRVNVPFAMTEILQLRAGHPYTKVWGGAPKRLHQTSHLKRTTTTIDGCQSRRGALGTMDGGEPPTGIPTPKATKGT